MLLGWQQYLLLRVFKFPPTHPLNPTSNFFSLYLPPNKNSSKYNIPFMTPMIVPSTVLNLTKAAKATNKLKWRSFLFRTRISSPWLPATPGLRCEKKRNASICYPFSQSWPDSSAVLTIPTVFSTTVGVFSTASEKTPLLSPICIPRQRRFRLPSLWKGSLKGVTMCVRMLGEDDGSWLNSYWIFYKWIYFFGYLRCVICSWNLEALGEEWWWSIEKGVKETKKQSFIHFEFIFKVS